MAAVYVTFVACGRQYRAKVGDVITTQRLPLAIGDETSFPQVILVENADGSIKTGEHASGVSVQASVVSHLRGEKLRIFKMRRRKSSRRTHGHRQALTRVSVDAIAGE